MSIKKVIAIVCLLFLLLCSCRTRYITTEVPVMVEHTTMQHTTDIVRDTLIMRDSVYHYVQGDTTVIERWHTLQNVNNVVRVDTVVEYKEKPVTVTRTEVREVNVLKWWQKALMWAGGLLMVALVVLGVVIARRISKI